MIERVQKKPCGGSFHFLFPDESVPRVEMGGVTLTTHTETPHTLAKVFHLRVTAFWTYTNSHDCGFIFPRIR